MPQDVGKWMMSTVICRNGHYFILLITIPKQSIITHVTGELIPEHTFSFSLLGYGHVYKWDLIRLHVLQTLDFWKPQMWWSNNICKGFRECRHTDFFWIIGFWKQIYDCRKLSISVLPLLIVESAGLQYKAH